MLKKSWQLNGNCLEYFEKKTFVVRVCVLWICVSNKFSAILYSIRSAMCIFGLEIVTEKRMMKH